jgi:hypothetical protein
MAGVKRGDRVSLNTMKRSFLFQDGEGGLNLIAGHSETGIIPANATDQHLEQINNAIRAEQLSVGWAEARTEILDRDSDIKSVIDGGRNKIEKWMYDVRDNKGIQKETKVLMIEKAVLFEKAGKNRSSVLASAEHVLKFLGGVSPVEDGEQEKIEIKLTSGNEDAEVK